MKDKKIYVYYSAPLDEVFTLEQPPPKGMANKELMLCLADIPIWKGIFYIGVF